ncbi:hypothetical protein GCM10010302_69690 [Streptomyces polychromogenes]|uniref:Uncharacterized protein n=1 Tax=Streptomyces polychromogenes TaxID=67342 RepID=A0ABP3FL92_9ACTN
MVVDHQDPDTNHKTPKGRGTDDYGYGAGTGWPTGRRGRRRDICAPTRDRTPYPACLDP